MCILHDAAKLGWDHHDAVSRIDIRLKTLRHASHARFLIEHYWRNSCLHCSVKDSRGHSHRADSSCWCKQLLNYALFVSCKTPISWLRACDMAVWAITDPLVTRWKEMSWLFSWYKHLKNIYHFIFSQLYYKRYKHINKYYCAHTYYRTSSNLYHY